MLSDRPRTTWPILNTMFSCGNVLAKGIGKSREACVSKRTPHQPQLNAKTKVYDRRLENRTAAINGLSLPMIIPERGRTKPLPDIRRLFGACSLVRLACSQLVRILAPRCSLLQLLAPSRIGASHGRVKFWRPKCLFRNSLGRVPPLGLEPRTY